MKKWYYNCNNENKQILWSLQITHLFSFFLSLAYSDPRLHGYVDFAVVEGPILKKASQIM